jgi:hypothetical protein
VTAPIPAALPQHEIVRLGGHLLDSTVLPKVLDAIVDAGARYTILELDVGATRADQSHIRLEVSCRDDRALGALLEGLQVHGVNVEGDEDVEVADADQLGVLPEGFYSTTNLATWVRVEGHWVPVERPEMDCAIVVNKDSRSARTVLSVSRSAERNRASMVTPTTSASSTRCDVSDPSGPRWRPAG